MGFRINTNTPSIAAQRALGGVNRASEESFSKLSSGLRITKAADDAAGLAISEKIKSHIRSSRQANRNANDAVSMVQVAEGGLNESSTILTRMREMAIQAATDTLGDSERAMASFEYEAMKSELDRIALSTTFNGKKLLDGSGGAFDFQVGVGEDSADDRISFEARGFNARTQALGVAGVSILSKQSAQASLSNIDRAFDNLSTQRAVLGSIQNRLQSSSSNLGIYTQNMDAANNRIRDLDYAEETSQQARNGVVSQASTAVLAQANMTGQAALRLIE